MTADLLPRIIGAAAHGTLFGDDNAARECIVEGLKTLFPGWAEQPQGEDSKAVAVELPPITDLLSTIDFLLQSGTAPAPNFDLEKLARARHLFERAIFEQLARVEDPDALAMEGVPDAVRDEWSNAYVRKVMTGRTTGTPTRARAVDYILSLSREEPVTLLSTNYDIEIEQELYARLGYRAVFEEVDFGTPVRDPVLAGYIRVRRTRGSPSTSCTDLWTGSPAPRATVCTSTRSVQSRICPSCSGRLA